MIRNQPTYDLYTFFGDEANIAKMPSKNGWEVKLIWEIIKSELCRH